MAHSSSNLSRRRSRVANSSGVKTDRRWFNTSGTIAASGTESFAAVDNFELRFGGTGAHAAMPHLGDDPILAAAAFIGSVQRIVSRAVDPQTPLVVSITQVHGGNVGNVVANEVWLQGTCRFFDATISDLCQ